MTAAFLLLVGFAATPQLDYIALLLFGSVLGVVLLFRGLFPHSGLLLLSVANGIVVYGCLFVFFLDVNFVGVPPIVAHVGFLLPIAALGGSAILHRRSIERLVNLQRLPDPVGLSKVLKWLVPVAGIGAVTFVLPALSTDPQAITWAFLAAMLAIAGVVWVVSRDVCLFLVDSGLLFADFFQRISRLIAPAFAFTTLWSVLVIVFASLYRVIELRTPEADFLVHGVARDLTFEECLYFSLVTLATVGYGDIIPLSAATRVVVALQVIGGTLLLLFGFYELINYARERRRHTDPPDHQA